MKFDNLLNEKFEQLSPVFDQLFDFSLLNQTHGGDMLLVKENAGYYEDIEKSDNSDPYTIGPRLQGHSERTHYDYIGDYVKKPSSFTFENYLKTISHNPERFKEIKLITEQESKSIQEEMGMYLKVWESETFIKKMSQLSRLVNHEDYDWHFKIKTHKKNIVGGLSKNTIIHNLIEKFNKVIPKLSESLKKSYHSQLRNAIAHSQYAIVGRDIILNNYDENKNGSIAILGFNDWTNIFHETIIIFSLYVKLMKAINESYYQASLSNNKSFEIRINRLHPIKETKYFTLYTRDYFKDWGHQECE